MRLYGATDIAAQPEKIWPFLVEPEKILEWYFPLQEFEYTGEQRSGVGTTFTYAEESPGGLMRLNFQATEWVENERIVFSMTSGDFLKSDEQRWIVETTPSGSRFVFEEEAKFPYGILGTILGAFARIASQANVRKMLGKLKSLAET